jgi:hypothetical protein
MPGRRSDRTRPRRSAASWGLELRSRSPSSPSAYGFSHPPGAVHRSYFHVLTAQHNTYPAVSLPCPASRTPTAKAFPGLTAGSPTLACALSQVARFVPGVAGSTARSGRLVFGQVRSIRCQ